MANIRILARNLADTATITADPAMSTTLPVTNVQRQTSRARTARTTGLASQDIKLAWSGDQVANMVAWSRDNASTVTPGTDRFLGYSGAAWTTGIVDTTAQTTFSTTGLNTHIDVHTEADFRLLKNRARYFTGVTTMESAILRLADASNPDGYREITRLFVGQYEELAYQPPFGGVELEVMDAGKSARASDGTLQVSKGWKARQLSLDLQFIPDADLATLWAIARYLGKDRECWVSLYPGEGGLKELYNQMVCRLVEVPKFNPHFPGLHRGRFVFQES